MGWSPWKGLLSSWFLSFCGILWGFLVGERLFLMLRSIWRKILNASWTDIPALSSHHLCTIKSPSPRLVRVSTAP